MSYYQCQRCFFISKQKTGMIRHLDRKNKCIKNIQFSNNFSELPLENEIIEKDEPICLVHCKSKKFKILRDKLKKISYKFIRNLELPDGEI